jgi:hypothetical protein
MATAITKPSEDVFPRKDADLSLWAQNFSTNWTPANWGVTVPTVAAITDAVTAFATALQTQQDNPGPANKVAKNDARASMELLLRQAARAAKSFARSNPDSAPGLAALGLRQLSPGPTPIPAPTDAPSLAVQRVTSGIVLLRVNQTVNGESVTARAFPSGVATCQIQFRRGASTVYEDAGLFRRVNVPILTAGITAGTVIEMRARYITARGLEGPWSQGTIASVF